VDYEFEYQLVIQFRLDDTDMTRWEAILQFETELEDWLDGDSLVDGHDAGSGEMNIFVHTNDPAASLKLIQALLPHSELASLGYCAGFRRFSEDDFTPAWPPGSEKFDVV
jgi:hypothetical protein